MNKRSNIVIFIFAFISLLLGIATYITRKYQYYEEYNLYLAYSTVIFIILTLSLLLSRFQQSRYKRQEKYMANRLKMWNGISYRVKKAGETSFNKLPIGIIVINNNYDILWSNEYAKKIFMSQLESINIKNICPEISNRLDNVQNKFTIHIYGRIYEVDYEAEHNVVYFTDATQIVEIQDKYQQRLTAVGFIEVDNLEEVLSDLDVQERAEYMWKVITIIAKWAESFGTYVRAYSDNHYFIVMDYSQLLTMVRSNFSILDDVKLALNVTSTSKISLSIGIACIDEGIVDLSKHANELLELALNRGGDQAVVRINEDITYYGAKTDPVPKESKVEVRIKSEELQSLIKSSKRVLVVGHKNLDADGFGATLAVYKMAKSLGVESYMIIDNKNNVDATVEKIISKIMKEYVSLTEDIISPSKALDYLNDDTLLMIVDCQREILVADSRLYKKAKKVGVIDHHRKGEGAIEKPDFYYATTSASSSVELIVELFAFFENEIMLSSMEATWLLLGVIVDTNNFIYRASSKTFEVASILAKYGADMTEVKSYLKEELNEKIMRSEFINNVEFYKGHVGISVGRPDMIYDRATLAKISDELISIVGVDVGVTIGMINEKVIGISARSLGSINVQMLMEKMGGGGHLNNAAAQIQSLDIKEVITKLKGHIDEYISQEEEMKVILIKEVKGRGKRGDIIELQPGFANHLIRNSQAILASPENIRNLAEERHQEAVAAEKHLQEMKDLKKYIEDNPIKISVRVGAEGKLFGSVSMKQVVDTFEKEKKVTLDKRKINYVDNITSLGTFDIPIQLHKEVLATIKLYVVEKE